MKQRNYYLLGIALALGIVSDLEAAPWFTGPIIAPAGRTIPKGHTNLEIYSFNTIYQGAYDAEGHVTPDKHHRNYSVLPVLTQGLTNKMDIQAVTSYNFNENNGAHSSQIGDTSITLGYQALVEQEGSFRPCLRLTLQEILPTSPYDHLNPIKHGTDASGLGSYQTGVGFDFQKLKHFRGVHYLRSRLILSYLASARVHIHGFSSYGGHGDTDGYVHPGNNKLIDVSAEYTLTQHWVAVMEANGSTRSRQTFNGFHGTEENRNDALSNDVDTIGNEVGKQVSLAPAIEYNFNPNVGIIGGAWFPVYGRSTSKFVSYVLAINAFW